MAEVQVSLKARPHQKALIEYFRNDGKHAVCIWHRKGGKDRGATFVESELACKRVGLYWHALPNYADARKVVWDAITPDGKRLIDVSFPPEIIKKRSDHEMKLELVNGSIWQPVGADNYNGLVGAFPIHITWSEFALMHPAARPMLLPGLAAADGTELVITTPRGYNHAYDLYQYGLSNPKWFTSLLTVNDSGLLSEEILEGLRATMPEELFRQEYLCDWSAANVGSVLGRYLEEAEKQGRISNDVEYDPAGTGIHISADIGRYDTSAWWFWQPCQGGFRLVDYDEDSGLDAEEWAERLKLKLSLNGYKLDRLLADVDSKKEQVQGLRDIRNDDRLSAASRTKVEEQIKRLEGELADAVSATTQHFAVDAAESVRTGADKTVIYQTIGQGINAVADKEVVHGFGGH